MLHLLQLTTDETYDFLTHVEYQTGRDLKRYADYGNHLDRGKRYVRTGRSG